MNHKPSSTRDPLPKFFLAFSGLAFFCLILLVVGTKRFLPQTAEIFQQTTCVYPPCPPPGGQPPAATPKPQVSPSPTAAAKPPLAAKPPSVPEGTIPTCKAPPPPTQALQEIDLAKPASWWTRFWSRLIALSRGKIPTIFQENPCPRENDYSGGGDQAAPLAPPQVGPPITAGAADPCSRHSGNKANYENCIQAVAFVPEATIACADDPKKVCAIDWEKAYWAGAPIDDKNDKSPNGPIDERVAWQQDNRQRYQQWFVGNGSDPCGAYGGDKDDCQAFALTALQNGIPLHEMAVIKDGQIVQFLEGNLVNVGDKPTNVGELLNQGYRNARQTNLQAQRAAVFEQVLKSSGYDNRYLYQAITNAAKAGKDFLVPFCPNPQFCSAEAIKQDALLTIAAYSDLKLPTAAVIAGPAAAGAEKPTRVTYALKSKTVWAGPNATGTMYYITLPDGSTLEVSRCPGSKVTCVDGFPITDLPFDPRGSIDAQELYDALIVKPTAAYAGTTVTQQIKYEGQEYTLVKTASGGVCLQKGTQCLSVPQISYQDALGGIYRGGLEAAVKNALLVPQKVSDLPNTIKVTSPDGKKTFYFTPEGIFSGRPTANNSLGVLPKGVDFNDLVKTGIPALWIDGLMATETEVKQKTVKVQIKYGTQHGPMISPVAVVQRLTVNVPSATQGKTQQVWFSPIRTFTGSITGFSAYTQSSGYTLPVGNWETASFGRIEDLDQTGLNPMLAESIAQSAQTYARRLETLLKNTPTTPSST